MLGFAKDDDENSYEPLVFRKSDVDKKKFNTVLDRFYDQLIHPTLYLDKEVTDALISKCVLLTGDREEIEKQPTALMRNAALLKILIDRPFDTQGIFLDVLIESDDKNMYSLRIVHEMKAYVHGNYWLLPKYVGEDKVSDHKVKLQKNYKFLVKNTTNISVCDHLLGSNVITSEDMEEIFAANLTTNDSNRRLLGKLLRKDINAYNALLEAYRTDSQYIDVAKRIEETDVTYHERRMIQTGNS